MKRNRNNNNFQKWPRKMEETESDWTKKKTNCKKKLVREMNEK